MDIIIKKKIICKIKKTLNKLIKNPIFVELKKNFLINSNIENFKLLIIFWNSKISNTIDNFKYSLDYNLKLSITNSLGNPIFFNYISFSSLNICKNSFSNIQNNEKIILFLFNSYNNSQNNFSLIDQIIINKTIKKKNKKWKKLNNFYLKYTKPVLGTGTVTFSYDIGKVVASLIYDFKLTNETQTGGKAFPYIPSATTSFSCDFNKNFYIFDKIYNSTIMNILNYQQSKYIWGKITATTGEIPIYGCTGLYTSLTNFNGSSIYGFYCYSEKDINDGAQLFPCYLTKQLTSCGEVAIGTRISTSQNFPYIYTYTGTDIGIYSNKTDNPNTACSVSGAITNKLGYYNETKDFFNTSIGNSSFEIFTETPEPYYGTASIIYNSTIFIYQSIAYDIYYIDYNTKKSKKAVDSNGNYIVPHYYYPTGITSHTDKYTNQSFLYIAYFDGTTRTSTNYITYIYKYILSDIDGSLTLVSYITGGIGGTNFYNIGFMTGNMNITSTGNVNDYTIYCYEYSLNYSNNSIGSISRIISVAF